MSALTYAIVLLPACKGWGFTAGLFGTRALWIIALSALCGTASYLCYYKALKDGLASVVVPIDKLSILVTVLFSYIVFHERLSRKALTGLAVLVAGTLVMLV